MASRVGLLLLVLLAGCSAAPSDDAKTDGEPEVTRYVAPSHEGLQRINVDVDGVDLVDVMEQISRRFGVEIVVCENVEEVVRVSLMDIPWREAVDVIARMARCTVEEHKGKLYVDQCHYVTIQFTRADVRTVLQLMAAYSGTNIVLSEGVKGKVTTDLKGIGARWHTKTWLRAIEALVRTAGFHARLKGDIITITERRPRTGTSDLDGEPPDPPAEPPVGPAPKNLLRARGVSLNTWVQLMSAYSGKDLLIGQGKDRTIDVDLEDTHWFFALLRATSEADAQVLQEGDLLRVTLPDKAVRSASEPARFRLEHKDGRLHEWTVEAVVIPPENSDEKESAVISDRIYQEGDALFDEKTDEELEGLIVESISKEGVRLRVSGLGDPLVVRFPPVR